MKSEKIQPVSFTESAIKEINHILATKNIPEGYGVRIGVKGGMACGGGNFYIGFDKLEEGDEIYQMKGFSLYIEKKQVMYLLGTQVDYVSTADAQGFTFDPPPSLAGEQQ